MHNCRAAATVTAPFPGPGSQTWSAHRAVVVVLAAAIVAAGAWAVAGVAPTDRLVAVLVALFALVGLMIAATRRLTVGPEGFAVRSLRGTREVGWESVRSVREVDSRRMGAAGSTIEVDLIDDTLLVFGRTELGVDPRTVGPALRRWWHGAGHDG